MKRHECGGDSCEICRKSKYMALWRSKNSERLKRYQGEYNKRYYLQNREKVIVQTRGYYEDNKEQMNKRKREYYEENKDYFLGLKREYWQEKKDILAPKNTARYYANRERYNKTHYQTYKKPRYDNDPDFRLKEQLAARIRGALINGYNSARTEELIGCTIPELRVHLEKQFLPGMTWDNHAITGWHIDHIKPCAAFDLRDPAQQRACFHYTNLRPMWYADNIRKGTNFDDSAAVA